MVELVVLASGSRGNCTLVRAGRTAVLIDAGLSAKQIVERLAAVGQDPRGLSAILLTHEHIDHTRGVAVLARRFTVPVIANAATWQAAEDQLCDIPAVEFFVTGTRFAVGALEVTPFATPHDAAEPVGFVLESEGLRVGYATDLGHVTRLVAARLAGCHALVFEANHDLEMLMSGPYPWATKQRVASRTGHLSNEHAAEFLPQVVGEETEHLVLAHLSETNNDPALARATVETALVEAGRTRVSLTTARQDRPAAAVRL